MTTKNVVCSILLALHRKAPSNGNGEQTTAIYIYYIYIFSGDYLQCFFKHEQTKMPCQPAVFSSIQSPPSPLSKAGLQLLAPAGAGGFVLGLPCMIVNVTYLYLSIDFILACVFIFFPERIERMCIGFLYESVACLASQVGAPEAHLMHS